MTTEADPEWAKNSNTHRHKLPKKKADRFEGVFLMENAVIQVEML